MLDLKFRPGKNLLMTVFGHAVSITYVLQIVTSVVVLGLYALSESMQEQKAKLQSDRSMVLLATFLIRHHPTINSIAKLGEIMWGKEAEKFAGWKYFSRCLENFAASGALPGLDPSARTSLLAHFGSMVYVSIFAPISCFALLTQPASQDFPLDHTAIRKNVLSRMMVILSANIFAGFILAEFLLAHHPVLCFILLISPFFAILQCLILLVRVAKEQQAWKEFWKDRLLEIMAVAARDNNHDLFNRALFLKNDVESQPDLPIPGKLSLYTTVYSVAQVTILFFSRTLHLN
jgi:hypothetical protein